MGGRELDDSAMVNTFNYGSKNRVEVMFEEVTVGQPENVHIVFMKHFVDVVQE